MIIILSLVREKIYYWSDSSQRVLNSTSDPTDGLNLIVICRPKVEFGSPREKLDVWPRPKLFYYAFVMFTDIIFWIKMLYVDFISVVTKRLWRNS